MEELSRSFRAMNTDVLAVVSTGESNRQEASNALDALERLFATNEAAMSRFLPESELSRLNRSAGVAFHSSPLLFQVVEAAIEAARETDGIFDPTVLTDLIAAGYDRSFELLTPAGGRGETARQTRPDRTLSSHSGLWRQIRMDSSSNEIILPLGCALDLGGIGKGWTVDQAATMLHPFANFAVDAGGDIYAAGVQADGSPWTIGVMDPFNTDRDLMVLAVSDRAVATSTTSKRRWVSEDGRQMHHLIDPRTGRPGNGDVVSATVLAGTVARAEVLAKTVLLLGSRDGTALLQDYPEIEWVLVLADRNTLQSSRLTEVQYAS